MKSEVIKKELGVTAFGTTKTFKSKELATATNAIVFLGENMRKAWFSVAHIVSEVDANKWYEADGYETVHDWTNDMFGIKKSASYSLLTIGREYTKEITNKNGKVIGFRSNLTEEGNPDFSKTQIEKMLPLGHEGVVKAVTDGDITPDMTVAEIREKVKELKAVDVESEEVTDTEDTEVTDTEDTEVTDTEEEILMIEVWDKNGKKYIIPVDVLLKYNN